MSDCHKNLQADLYEHVPSALRNSTESGGTNEAVQLDVPPFPGSTFCNYDGNSGGARCDARVFLAVPNVNTGPVSKLKASEVAGGAQIGQGSEQKASARPRCGPSIPRARIH